jgi:hypothetical protein
MTLRTLTPDDVRLALTNHGSLRAAARALKVPAGTVLRIASTNNIRSSARGGRPRTRNIAAITQAKYTRQSAKFTENYLLRLNSGFSTWRFVAKTMNLPYSTVVSRARRLGLQSSKSYVRLTGEDLERRRHLEDTMLALGHGPSFTAWTLGVHPSTVSRRTAAARKASQS